MGREDIESQLYLQAIIFFEGYMEDAIFRFHETKNNDTIMAATNLFGSIMNIHPAEDGNEIICCLILTHVLIQIKCCLFPVLLSSFHKCGRRHYIQAVKRYHENPSMLYTMIAGYNAGTILNKMQRC